MKKTGIYPGRAAGSRSEKSGFLRSTRRISFSLFIRMHSSYPDRPPRIIVADDHEWIRQILAQVARETLPLAEVVETDDGRQALDAYRDGPCDFLITNHAMPRMDGAELIRTLRPQAPDLPILMVSIHPSAKADALAAGATWFLTKEQIMEHMPPLLRGHTRGGTASE